MLRALSDVDYFNGRPWRDMQKVNFSHPLAINEAARSRFNIGPFDRAGYAQTVMSMSGQRPDAVVGASFSAVFDAADWDRSIAQNPPGQSELPDSPHFADLGKLWAAGEYFPLAFSEREVAANAHSTLMWFRGNDAETYDGLEVHFRRLGGFRRRLEERIFLETKDLRRQVRGKLLRRGVVFLNALVVAHPFHGDPVLGP